MKANIIDQNLSYGMQDFFFCDTTADSNFTYNLYQDAIGMILVVRIAKTGGSTRYAVSNDTYAHILTGTGVLANLPYDLPITLKDQRMQINK